MKPPMIQPRTAVVAITGGGRGIGRATGQLFAALGATVCLGDLDADAAADAAASIGSNAHPFLLDVGSRESVDEFIATVERTIGPIDVLVNNAGIMPAGRFLAESEETTAAVFEVNVGGVINGMRAVLPGMIGRGRGHIVNVASLVGKTELPGLASYTASKHAVLGLTAAVRPELAGTGVTLTAVLPSIVNTELSSGIRLGLARFLRIEPEAVAAAIVGSLERRPKEVTVPRVFGLYPVLRPFIPDPLEDLVRRVIGDDKALKASDPAARARYQERMTGAGSRSAEGDGHPAHPRRGR